MRCLLLHLHLHLLLHLSSRSLPLPSTTKSAKPNALRHQLWLKLFSAKQEARAAFASIDQKQFVVQFAVKGEKRKQKDATFSVCVCMLVYVCGCVCMCVPVATALTADNTVSAHMNGAKELKSIKTQLKHKKKRDTE